MVKPATPLPWALMPHDETQITNMIGHSDPLYHAECNARKRPLAEDDAAYIVHACNAYPKLLRALSEARTQLAISTSVLAGQDKTRPELIVQENRITLAQIAEALEAA